MFINATGYYVPADRVDNEHFRELNGLTSEWIEQRTGILTRSKAKPEENVNTMSLEAVRDALPHLPYHIREVDLIVSASYSPHDTVATAAHTVQHVYQIAGAKALYLSSACSSFMNALEVVEGYFEKKKKKKALVLSADKNFSSRRSLSVRPMQRCWRFILVAWAICPRRWRRCICSRKRAVSLCRRVEMSSCRLVPTCQRMCLTCWLTMAIPWMISLISLVIKPTCASWRTSRSSLTCRKRSSCITSRSWVTLARLAPLWSMRKMRIISSLAIWWHSPYSVEAILRAPA